MKFKLKPQNLPSAWGMVVFLVAFLYLSRFWPDGLASYSHSTEFIGLGAMGGNHYALQHTVLLRILGLVSKLTQERDLISWYVLTSALASGVLSFWYVLLSHLQKQVYKTETWLSFLLKNVAVFGWLGLSTFLLQGVFVERYMLFIFLAFGLLVLRLSIGKQTHNWIKSLFVVGLVVVGSMHWAFWWVMLGWVISWIFGRKQPLRLTAMSLILLGTALAALSLGFNWILVNKNPGNYSYVGATTVNEVLQNYTHSFFNDGFSQDFSFNKAGFGELAMKAWDSFYRPTGLILFGFILIGLIRLLRRSGYLFFWAIWLGVGLYGLPLFFFSGLDAKHEAMDLYALIPMFYGMTILWLGMLVFFDRVRLAITSLHGGKPARMGLSIGILLLFSGFLYRGNFVFGEWMDEETLLSPIISQATGKSLIFCFDTHACADLIYLAKVKTNNDELTIVPYFYSPKTYVLDLSAYRPFSYNNYPYTLWEIITTGLHDEGVRLYSFGVSGEYYRFLGFDLGFLHYIPMGNFGELALTTPDILEQAPLLELDDHTPSSQAYKNPLLSQAIRNRILNAQTYFRSGAYSYGYWEMNAASQIAHLLSSDEFADFLTGRNDAEQQVRNALQLNASKLESIEPILLEIPLYIEAGYPGRVADLIRGALMLSPYDAALRDRVAEYYTEVGLDDLALTERNNALQLRTMSR